MDKLTKEERSKRMASIKGKNTKPEILLRKWLFEQGFRYRVCVNYIPGHPDLFLRRYNTAVFVHGCFWHRHIGCKNASTPENNKEYWLKKFENNANRDSEVKRVLSEQGIKELIVWECTIRRMAKNDEFKEEMLMSIMDFISGNEEYREL